MKAVGVVTDSHSSISQEEAKRLGIRVLPMPFYFDDECYYENVNITREEFFKKIREGSNVTTSQPSPVSVQDIWDEALSEYEKILYIPISSGISGSCMTAAALAEEAPYEGRVFVVDNGRVATPLHRSILDALELIGQGYSAEEIKGRLEASRAEMVIYVGVDTMEFLKKGGRVNSTTALLGTMLNIKPVLKFDIGSLDVFQKCRGTVKMRRCMIDAMKHDLETTFKEKCDKGEVYLMAASSADEETTNRWIEEIKEAFPGMDVMCDNLSLGVCCHTGPGGLGIGCSCKP